MGERVADWLEGAGAGAEGAALALATAARVRAGATRRASIGESFTRDAPDGTAMGGGLGADDGGALRADGGAPR